MGHWPMCLCCLYAILATMTSVEFYNTDPACWMLFRNHGYRVIKEYGEVKFEDASMICRALDAELASIHNKEEDLILERLRLESGEKTIMIGLERTQNGLYWTDGTQVDYISGQYSSLPGAVACVDIVDGGWQEVYCNGKHSYFICKQSDVFSVDSCRLSRFLLHKEEESYQAVDDKISDEIDIAVVTHILSDGTPSFVGSLISTFTQSQNGNSLVTRQMESVSKIKATPTSTVGSFQSSDIFPTSCTLRICETDIIYQTARVTLHIPLSLMDLIDVDNIYYSTASHMGYSELNLLEPSFTTTDLTSHNQHSTKTDNTMSYQESLSTIITDYDIDLKTGTSGNEKQSTRPGIDMDAILEDMRRKKKSTREPKEAVGGAVMGGLAICILAIVILLIVLLDLIILFEHLKVMVRNLKQSH